MKIITLYDGFLYAVQYDVGKKNVFDELFDYWDDVSGVYDFITVNEEYLQSDFWGNRMTPFDVAQKVVDEAEELEEEIFERCNNAKDNDKPDLDDMFKYLDGKYRDVYELTPTKAYGIGRPSFLRLYAIKVDSNVYVITGGGIKLAKKIQDSPGLKESVIRDIDKVRHWMIENGILDKNDIIKTQNNYEQ